MLAAVGLLAAVALAGGSGGEPVVRDCGTSAYGDLGRGWTSRAIVAGPLALVGLRDGYRGVRAAAPRGFAWPLKVLVVVEPRAVVTLTIDERSRSFASLAYASAPVPRPTPLAHGSQSVRFEACKRANAGEPWNRGTQFPGYFLVARPGCVAVRVATAAGTWRRTLRFGVAACG